MAALDFPNSPTLNQQYAAPNGVTYQWDGAAWIVTGGPPGQLWTASGTTLVPTDQTKTVTLPGPTVGSTIIMGAATGKGRVQQQTSGGVNAGVGLFANRDWNSGNAQDDTAAPSWGVQLRTDQDQVVIQRQPAGSTSPTGLVTVDNAGAITMVGRGKFGTRGILVSDVNGSWLGNNWSSGQGYDNTKAFWQIYLSTASDAIFFYRTPPAGGAVDNFHIDANGNLVIAGATGTKASGTTWTNPSDPRLKDDVAPYARGLAELCQLEPITYHLKANPDGPLCYGFDAEKVRAVFPECVSEARMKLDPDDDEESDVLVFDMHPILVALVNAARELAVAAGIVDA
jgi:hypothetical protein